jgi:hypothetical protein
LTAYLVCIQAFGHMKFAYVRAKSEEEALAMAKERLGVKFVVRPVKTMKFNDDGSLAES